MIASALSGSGEQGNKARHAEKISSSYEYHRKKLGRNPFGFKQPESVLVRVVKVTPAGPAFQSVLQNMHCVATRLEFAATMTSRDSSPASCAGLPGGKPVVSQRPFGSRVGTPIRGRSFHAFGRAKERRIAETIRIYYWPSTRP